MKNLTPRTIAAACGGTLVDCDAILDKEITGVVIDSRKVEPGCLFAPIRGARVDAHDFISQVMEAGALLTLTEKEEKAAGHPHILVKKTEDALLMIAEFYRQTMDIPVVGITGSVGKTSTKEMIASVLSQKFRTLKTAGNYNSTIGLPLTIFRLREEDEIAVLEMGINHFGEMSKMAKAARPDTMVITNIGTCHLEFLKDRDGVFEAKTECFEYVPFDGTVVLNGDDDKLCRVDQVHGHAPIFYGMSPMNRVYAENIRPLGLKGTACTIVIDDREFDVTVPVPGMHMVMNALAGAAVGSVYGLTDEEIKAGIEGLETLSGRFHILENESRTVIDDCYNANPMSMKAALGVLGDVDTHTTAILGDMGELGEKDEARLHREVGVYAGEKAIDSYILVGKLAKYIGDGIRSEKPDAQIHSFETVEDLLGELLSLIPNGDTVLVKASHFMGFDRIVEALR